MKITESKIRQYIKTLLMETFYVDPQGRTMDRKEFEGRKKLSAGEIASIPKDAPGVVRSFPVKLASEAKEEYENMQLNDPEFFNMLKEKAISLAFGFTYDELLDNLTFTESDIEYINPDINQSLKDKTNFNTAINLLESLMPKTGAYLKHITAASDDFSAGPDTAQYHRLDPQKTLSFHDSFFKIFFKPPDNPGDIAMGKSLTDLVVNKILSVMANVKSQTPVEFAQQHFPEFEKVVNAAFKNNPNIANNARTLEPYRKGYLDSIYYVLQELFAEINYEFLYYDRGPMPTRDIPINPEYVMVFLPDDREMVKFVSDQVINYLESGENRYANVNDDYHWTFSDVHRDDSYYRALIPELRSMPSYYDTKFSVNPRYASYAEKEIDIMFNSRLYDNLTFGIGFRDEGIESEMFEDEIGEKWQES